MCPSTDPHQARGGPGQTRQGSRPCPTCGAAVKGARAAGSPPLSVSTRLLPSSSPSSSSASAVAALWPCASITSASNALVWGRGKGGGRGGC